MPHVHPPRPLSRPLLRNPASSHQHGPRERHDPMRRGGRPGNSACSMHPCSRPSVENSAAAGRRKLTSAAGVARFGRCASGQSFRESEQFMMVGGAASSSTPVSSLRPVSDVLGPVFSLDMYRRTFSKRQNQQQQRRRRGGGQQRQRGALDRCHRRRCDYSPSRRACVSTLTSTWRGRSSKPSVQRMGPRVGDGAPATQSERAVRASDGRCGSETAAAAGGIVAAVLEMVRVKPTPDSPKK